MLPRILLFCVSLGLLSACSTDEPAAADAAFDAGVRDRGPRDVGGRDAYLADSETIDTGISSPEDTGVENSDDAEISDVMVEDAQLADSGFEDAEIADAETPDNGSEDAEIADAETPDNGSEDAEIADAETPDSGSKDAAVVDTGYVVEATFDSVDGAPWPSPWVPAGGVDLAEVRGQRGQFRPVLTNYSLARMYYPGPAVVSSEATFTVTFDELSTQGVGLYARTTGGFLTQTSTPGLGYAVFVEGFRGVPGIGIWREVAGIEMEIQVVYNPIVMTSGELYRVRFRVEQIFADRTRLSARIWPILDPEPTQWQVDLVDIEPSLQGRAGGFAFDAWSNYLTGGPVPPFVAVDDLQIISLP